MSMTLLAALVAPHLLLAQASDVGRSHHNLSVSGPGPIKAAT